MFSWTVFTVAILLTAPVRVELLVDASPKVTFHVVIYLYTIPIRLEGLIDKHGNTFFQHNHHQKMKLPLRQAASFASNLLKNAISKRIIVEGQIGTGDAHSTAMVIGGLRCVLGAFLSRWNTQIIIKPAFSKPIFKMRGHCILSFRGGDIILAGIKAFNDQLSFRKT